MFFFSEEISSKMYIIRSRFSKSGWGDGLKSEGLKLFTNYGKILKRLQFLNFFDICCERVSCLRKVCENVNFDAKCCIALFMFI